MAKTKVIFDTNVWVASIISGDSLHQKSIELLKKYDSIIYLSEDIVSETITVLKRYGEIEKAKKFVELIYSNSDFGIITAADYYQDTLAYFLKSDDKHLSFVDMSLVVLSKKYKIESFDKELRRVLEK